MVCKKNAWYKRLILNKRFIVNYLFTNNHFLVLLLYKTSIYSFNDYLQTINFSKKIIYKQSFSLK